MTPDELDGRLETHQRLITCIHTGCYREALTRGRRYEVLGQSGNGLGIKVQGDNGRTRFFPKSCFDLSGAPASVLVHWQFDEQVEDEQADYVDVSFELDDETRRYCSLTTPAYLRWLLEQPHADPGFWWPYTIVVRSLAQTVVDEMLHKLDQQGELLKASLPLNPIERTETT